jgi:hypothetical protein
MVEDGVVAAGTVAGAGIGFVWFFGTSASTGRSEMEIRLLSPRPSLGLFFCWVDMGLLSR